MTYPSLVWVALSKMTAEQRLTFESEYARQKKSVGWLVVLSIWPLPGLQLALLGRWGLLCAFLLTGGGGGVWYVIEWFLTPHRVREYNKNLAFALARIEDDAPKYTVSVDDLVDEYESNEIAADRKYQGESVLVHGTIFDIGKNDMGDMYIVVSGRKFLWPSSVTCFFADDQESLVADLSKEQRVIVKGRVLGENRIGEVQIGNCDLQGTGLVAWWADRKL